MLNGKNIVLGVTGGIAAYKACSLTSKLTQQGASVKVIMTKSAAEFVSPLTFQALSRQPVYTDTFDEKNPEKIAHIDLADWADLFVIAPATANLIGKIANGIADDMLSTTILATEADVYIAPAMNVHMYAHPAVRKNLIQLEQWGYKFIEPGDGYLACGYVGKGRLEEPETIIKVLDQDDHSSRGLLEGKNVLISAGPTQESVDPVRFFTNHSSGKMGYALARQATNLGATVTLISGPVDLTTPQGVKRIDVQTAEDMYNNMIEAFDHNDLVIKAAAVADYRPKVTFEHKMKKKQDDLILEMERTKDILKELGKRKSSQFLVGFAAETDKYLEYGRKKLVSKNLDAIVINDITAEGAGFRKDTNQVIYLHKSGKQQQLALSSKDEIAKGLLELIVSDMGEGL
ncbi:bifunctional phosphopantothenoylcysteine decarboxylase/phosphopantothenate--cysteine ligase CoaBC [Terrihalobacillus insolitus]|uniref:bifunctional phosphopantothenoylcysteine decarboxylase/phosphopantothenate--cysteine ligase CoaBC n=1 Tax=Terrihalobacillus insolitus TaxID=2950438 RepID=UPI0023404FE5|nr:bifunctional phosphopantothenoylcysteine decarboxylase/phosphopantothenate--cysteine ligase CoaBC [Terrihalobacillus insolitus]MDC3412893.1 bifunctional phosphopantothenoylcysteine decarboxylase/phosphopantothenate--cysteine ligase CoaBC [Terrihalobacillus insolitus]